MVTSEHNICSICNERNNINVSYSAQKLNMKTTIMSHGEILQLCYHHHELGFLEILVNVTEKRLKYKGTRKMTVVCRLFDYIHRKLK